MLFMQHHVCRCLCSFQVLAVLNTAAPPPHPHPHPPHTHTISHLINLIRPER